MTEQQLVLQETRGYRTRNTKKSSSKLIVRGRKRGKQSR